MSSEPTCFTVVTSFQDAVTQIRLFCYTQHVTSSHKMYSSIQSARSIIDPKDLIWIADAEQQYNRSREWFLKQIKLQKLHKTKIKGDRKVYLLRYEVEQLLQLRILDPQ